MKNARVLTVLAAAAGLSLASLSAGAVTLVGLTSANEIARIDTTNVAAATRTSITGLAVGERLLGIDTRPSDGKVYAISTASKLYTVNEITGAASFVVALQTPVINGSLGYGIDFNPVADFAGNASLRLVSSAGSNFAINASTGAVGNPAGMIPMGFTAVSYTNSSLMPAMAPPSTALYYINSADDTLSVATTAFNTPTITTVGSLGIDVLRANGFDILGNGQAFAALNLDDGSLGTGVFGIDLATGTATSLGTFNGTLTGLTVSAVPEPASVAMLFAGLMGVGVASRRAAAARKG